MRVVPTPRKFSNAYMHNTRVTEVACASCICRANTLQIWVLRAAFNFYPPQLRQGQKLELSVNNGKLQMVDVKNEWKRA